MRPDGAGWRLIGAEDQDLGAFEAVVLATGADLGGLWPGATVQSVRGQASWTAEARSPMPAAFGGYVIPTPDGGLLFGATHDRGDTDETLRLADHDRNLALLAKSMPILAARVASLPLQGRARRRAATPDRMPLAGAVPEKDGL
jgi:tRNA 5-methylaminomethyl-2-thiouridine biosynthesis bifunctional protein